MRYQQMPTKTINMKRNLIAAGFFAIITAGCGGGYNGQLVGVQDRPSWNNIIPYGMVYIPSGTLHIGQSDQDINNSLTQRTKSISIQGFFMDETEITNNEYRQFVYWVRDSIAAKTLGGDYIKTNEKTGKETVNWDNMAKFRYDDPEASESLADMYVPENEQLNGKVEFDVSKWIFEYYWLDIKEAAKVSNRGKPRSEFFRSGSVAVYPDTLVWVRDFSYSYNEPMTRNYFWHPAFDDYPVVGVTWGQANAFSAWRTKFWSDYRTARGEVINDPFRLPTESEWEYAARGGKDLSPYPWGGPYLRNSKGCLLANFKPGRGNYPDDGGFYTVRADAYWPNDYGLYNMSGNVAEWTITAYHHAAYSFVHDLNPDIRYDAKDDDPITLKRKVIRGGSWKDIGYFLQTGVRHWEYQDSAKSYIGFRNVLTFLGRSIND
jgi:gliding motility-associated lipoprotein GldK